MTDRCLPRAPGSLSVEDVSKEFAGHRVLRAISFDVSPGEAVAVVGANGSGKTTLLRILAGILLPDAGRATICDAKPGSAAAGFVPAGDRGLYWRLSGSANLEFFARLAGASARSARRMTHTAARAVGAEHLLGRRVGECSTGQRRRLMIAGALAGRFPVLLLDEPLEDLDAWGRDAVAAVVRDWTGEGGVVIMAAPSAAELPPAGRTIMLGAEGSTA